MPPRSHGFSTTDIGGELTPDVVEFALAMDRFRRKTGRRYPTCGEILGVLKSLGYERALPPEPPVESLPAGE